MPEPGPFLAECGIYLTGTYVKEYRFPIKALPVISKAWSEALVIYSEDESSRSPNYRYNYCLAR
jgi:hypothetical protein